jgi:MATE family multidrug resistance protein
MKTAIAEVWRVAMPLMVSTGTFSLVLFADRTLLLKYDGTSMSAAMTGGNLFWVLVCLPVGIASMTGAIVSQYVGAGKPDQIGRFLWQSVWISFSFAPLFAAIAYYAPWIFQAAGQPDSLIEADSIYLRILMIGAVGQVIETALSGFFSGTERTGTIMWVSIASGLINLLIDYVLIFGMLGFPSMGIAGAAIASVISFWFKVVVYAWLLMRPQYESRYRFKAGFGWDRAKLLNLVFFGFPTGLMYLTEAGGFTVMVLRIGTLGDVPLRATTMVINFNMIAFIPLIGVSIAASVLVGRHLTETGPKRAAQSVRAALVIGLVYSGVWMIAFLTLGDVMMSLYELNSGDDDSVIAIELARGLLGFVAIYVVLDAMQLILAGALRGAGDTWFVLFGGITASAVALSIGFAFEPSDGEPSDGGPIGNIGLHWWWTVLALWVCLLAVLMAIRFATGQWKKMRMVEE